MRSRPPFAPWLLAALLALHCAPGGPSQAPPAAAPSPPALSTASPAPPASPASAEAPPAPPSTAASGAPSAASPAGPLPSLAMVRGDLLPLMYDRGARGTAALEVREDLPGLLTALAVPAGDGVRGVPAGASKAWGLPPGKTFDLALANLRRRPAPSFRDVDVGAGVRLRVAQGEDPFVASWILALADLPGSSGARGALVGVPTRHHLVVYPIEDAGVSLAVQFMPVVLTRLSAAGPGALAPRMYLYRKGRVVEIPYQLDAPGFSMAAPREFLDLLRELPPAKPPSP